MSFSVERLSFFDGPRGSLRFAEHAPPGAHREGAEHLECNCTKDVTERPGGAPSHVAQTLRWTSEPDLGRPGGRLLVEVDEREIQWTYRWGDDPTRFDPGDHAYFSFRPPQDGMDGRVLTPPGTELQVEVTEPGYGINDHFFTTLYVGREVDTSAFFNGHSPSRVVDLAALHPEAVWVHANRHRVHQPGGERYAILDDHVESSAWRDAFQGAMRVGELSLPLLLDTEAPIADVHARAVADHALGAAVEGITAWLTRVLVGLGETALYRAQNGIDAEAWASYGPEAMARMRATGAEARARGVAPSHNDR